MPKVVPKSWMPNVSMKRIHLHWTGGGHKANSTDRKAYHILVEADGKLVRGDHSIEANAAPPRSPRANHTKSANTGAIGVSLCCMHGAVRSPFSAGSSPMTEAQWNTGLQVIADLAEKYRILVTPTTIVTHAEVEPNLNIPQNDKWDIVRLAFDDRFKGHRAVGEEMRAQVALLLETDRAGEDDDEVMDDQHRLPRFRVSGVSPSRLNLRDAPSGEKIGSLSERSIVERLGVFDEWWRVRTRLGFEGFVHSGFLKPA